MVISSLTLGVARDQGYQIIGEPEGTPGLVEVQGELGMLPINHDTPIVQTKDYWEEQL